MAYQTDDLTTAPPEPQQTLPNQDAIPVAAAPLVPSRCEEILAALQTIPLLDGLSENEYLWLVHHGTERMGVDGALIFREGDPACHMNILLHGEVHVRRLHSGPLALFIGRAGQISGKLPYSRMKTYGGDGYAVGPCWALDIHEDLFPEMLIAIPSIGQRCVSTLLDRVRLVTRMEQQAEKLSALGKLAANLAHELNNPASAAQRSAASLFTELRQYGEEKYRLGNLCLSEEQFAKYSQWRETTLREMSEFNPAEIASSEPLAQSDREDTLLRWLEAHDIPAPWSIAPGLAETTIAIRHLDKLAEIAEPSLLKLAISTFSRGIRVERMTETVLNSTVRIFDLISAIKDYSYMDQAPVQDVDLALSLTNTLLMMQAQLKGIKVETDFDPQLPPISAYGSELSQVWTALIENAIEAMDGHGTLRLITQHTGNMATVEIWDSGPGIDPAIQSRIFEPFFTTKPPGDGLGLGLDAASRIVGRHSGFLTVESRPGATCFQVRVPIDRADAY
jgi:signal transduction histidine kinase